MSRDDEFHLVDSIYEAALDPEGWPVALEQLTVQFDATASHLFVGDTETFELSLSLAVGLDPGCMCRYDGDPVGEDPRVEEALRRPIGLPFRDQDFITEREMDRHAYWQDWLRWSDVRYSVACFAGLVGRQGIAINVQRPRGAGPFEDEAVDRFTHLCRHVRRAVELGSRLGLEGASRPALAEVLDRLDTPLLLVDDRGSCTVVNQSAERLLAAKEGLRLRDGRLRGETSDLSRGIDRLLGSLGARGHLAAPLGGSVTIPRPSGRRPLSLTAAPLRTTLRANGRPVVGLLSISDPEAKPPTDRDLLRELYGLTPAEASFAAAFADSGSLTDTADRLGLTRETSRWRLKQLLAKTGSRGQAELVGVVLRTASSLRDDSEER